MLNNARVSFDDPLCESDGFSVRDEESIPIFPDSDAP